MNEASTSEKEAVSAYRNHLFSHLPLYTTRLVKEGDFPFHEREQVCTPEAAAVVLQDYFRDRDREEFVVCLLDTSCSLTGLCPVSVGGLSTAIVEPRQVMKVAILANAAAVIVAHNHLTGNPEPSREDIRITRQLVEAGKLMGVPVHDHLIILGDNGYTSLAQRGVIS